MHSLLLSTDVQVMIFLCSICYMKNFDQGNTLSKCWCGILFKSCAFFLLTFFSQLSGDFDLHQTLQLCRIYQIFVAIDSLRSTPSHLYPLELLGNHYISFLGTSGDSCVVSSFFLFLPPCNICAAPVKSFCLLLHLGFSLLICGCHFIIHGEFQPYPYYYWRQRKLGWIQNMCWQ